MSGVYYNEIDPFAAAWLRELMKAGEIPRGEVDERSIADVRAGDLAGFHQCHFFAGIGGWAYALRLAAWGDEPVWTGSCPCQPFSSAGAQAGGNDSRDLWPVWFQLIAQCRPVVVFGEQVEAAIRHGWLDRLCDDLEAEDYAIGACGLPGPIVGAYDIRQRLWFVADAGRERCERERLCLFAGEPRQANTETRRRGEACALDDSELQRAGGSARGEGCAERTSQSSWEVERRGELQTQHAGVDAGDMGNAEESRFQTREHPQRNTSGLAGPFKTSYWDAADWLECRDGKARPVEPGTFPLAHGVPARVGRLRGYGNAIKPQVAKAFIEAYLEARA